MVRRIGLRRKALAAVSMAMLTAGALGTSAAVATTGSGESPQVVIDWNSNALDAVLSAKVTDPAGTPPRPFYQPEALIYLAYTQAAVYDSVAKIAGRYAPYHDFEADSVGASLQAAVVAAAYNTLVTYLGDPGGTLHDKYVAALASLPDAGKAAGVSVGKAAADDLIAFRSGDGRNASVGTPFGQCTIACPPGLWVFAPQPAPQSAVVPWLGSMRPFLLRSSSQFRAAPPPALSSDDYADQVNEVKAYGASGSAVRTPAQRATAWFWLGNVPRQYNVAAQSVIQAHGMDLVDAARLLAMVDMVTSDAAIACWDSKYHYQFWRPITAIRNADKAGNPDIVADPTWTPLALTPQHPEYPSGHGCATTALVETFAAVLGTNRINVDILGGEGGSGKLTVSRHYRTVRDLNVELVNARVWVGYHFRGSVKAGEEIGQDVARWTLARYFQPLGNQDGDGENRGED